MLALIAIPGMVETALARVMASEVSMKDGVTWILLSSTVQSHAESAQLQLLNLRQRFAKMTQAGTMVMEDAVATVLEAKTRAGAN